VTILEIFVIRTIGLCVFGVLCGSFFVEPRHGIVLAEKENETAKHAGYAKTWDCNRR
jgi:hypothetical protein